MTKGLSKCARSGLVLVEMLLVLGIIAMMTSIALISFSAIYGKGHFRQRADDLVQALQMAYTTAQQSDRRYAVILNFVNEPKTWTLRQFDQLEAEGLSDTEEVVKTGQFDERFYLDYVWFDDGTDSREPQAGRETEKMAFHAGHGGWRDGGKIVVTDEDGNPWSIVIYRMGKPVELLEGDVAVFVPRQPKDMPF